MLVTIRMKLDKSSKLVGSDSGNRWSYDGAVDDDGAKRMAQMSSLLWLWN